MLARRYELIATLGEGGLASAYRARDEALGCERCVKLLGEAGALDVDTLRAEFALLRTLRHPNLVRVHDFGLAGGQAFFTSDVAPGVSLRAFVRGGADAALVTRALSGVLRALGALHRAGLIHGDVKPENVLVAEDGHATLIDLSCALRMDARRALVSGTPGYIAPERLAGRPLDGRADLFALGVTMRALGLGPAGLVERLVAPNPADRPASALEVQDELGAFEERDGDARAALQTAELFGREPEVARFVALLTSVRERTPGPRVLEICGPAGAGRSRLLSELKWLASRSLETVEGFSRVEDGVGSLFRRATGLAAIAAGARGAVEAHDHLAARREPIVLLLDDADDAEPRGRELALGFARLLCPNDPALLVLVRAADPPSLGADTQRLTLGPLETASASAWFTRAGFGEEAERAIAAVGTWPRAIAIAIDALGRGVPSAHLAAALRDHATSEETLSEATIAPEGLQSSGASPRAAIAPMAASYAAALARCEDGDPGRALALLGQLEGPEDAPRIVLAARCVLELGDANAALARVEACSGAGLRAPDRAALDALAARALLRLGRYTDALERARGALEIGALPPALRGELFECAGAAAMYADDLPGAEAPLRLAAELAREGGGRPRSLVRAESYRGILAFRRGDLEAACSSYAAALDAAEEHGLGDQIARAALNLGTARHQRGELAAALAAYQRGERIASALGQSDLLLILGFDLAKLYADLGALSWASAKAERVKAQAEAARAPFFVAAATSVLADVAEAQGRVDAAHALFEQARDGFAAQGAAREVCEEELELGRLAVLRGRVDLARSRVAAARSREGLGAMKDLEARALLIEARVLAAENDLVRAREQADRALALAERAHQQELAARALALAGELAARAGLESEAEELRSRARAVWSAMTVGLAPALLESFWRRPERIVPVAAQRSAHDASGRVAKLERLLAAFRKLNASLETADVLALALDEAIDVTGAERGFLLIDRAGKLEVAVARHIAREALLGEADRWSSTIAERTVASAEPVITVDAQLDPRFSANVSVHAMRLRSVIAVPIRSPSGVLGALYLDNRYQRARFDAADTDLLLAFADQVALAIENARLVEALRARGEELLLARKKVEALAAQQAQEIERLAEEVRLSKEVLEHRFDYSAIVGKSAALRRVFTLLDRVIDTPLSVLITGESGTGKELVARAVHFSSKGKDRPFVGINCAALPPTLLESELFGHVRGAFTGADRDRTGLVVSAKGGTLFLDELGEMSLDIQAKLLRVLQEHEVRPLGAAQAIPVDFRLVTATNRDLKEEVARGRFREDLYYRVAVVEVRLPALRERLEDLPELTQHFLTRAAKTLGREPPRVSAGALLKLSRHTFPGNIRELENLITKAVVLCDDGVIQTADVDVATPAKAARGRKESERATLIAALEQEGWNAVRAAKALGMPRATFYRRLRALGVERPKARRT